MDAEHAKNDNGRIMFEARLIRFKEKMEQHSENKKADMIAYRELRLNGDVVETLLGEHPPGVKPSQEFDRRAELAISGVHKELMKGIDAHKSGPANAIVISGYYASNKDEGHRFTYSGEGGMENGRQIADQEWTGGNKALQISYAKGIPVKVVRGLVKDGKKRYVYEGLYRIVECTREEKDGFKVCLFKFEGIDNESLVSGKVHFNPKAYYRRMSLAPFSLPPRKRRKKATAVYGPLTPAKVLLELNKERIARLREMKHVVSLDISNGKEALCIPLINDIDDEKIPLDYRYVTSLSDLSANAERIISLSTRHWLAEGCLKQPSHPTYCNGLLIQSLPEGIRECGRECKKCQDQCIVSQGVKYPLEVFKTVDKGWGVRCSVDIPSGAFVCEYIGSVISDHEAEDVADYSYLYSLDHFFLLQQKIVAKEVDFESQNMPPLPLSDEEILKEEFHGKYVVIDAKAKGNVGRFLNHGCQGKANLLAQMVLKPGCNSVFHHVAFFACEDIPRMTELCHDYGWNTSTEKIKHCLCRDLNCLGHLS